MLNEDSIDKVVRASTDSYWVKSEAKSTGQVYMPSLQVKSICQVYRSSLIGLMSQSYAEWTARIDAGLGDGRG